MDVGILVEIQGVFKRIYEIVEKSGYEFAYRTVREIRQYLSAAYELTEDKETFDFYSIIDEQLIQKILPKIHGNNKEIGGLLEELGALCVVLCICLNRLCRLSREVCVASCTCNDNTFRNTFRFPCHTRLCRCSLCFCSSAASFNNSFPIMKSPPVLKLVNNCIVAQFAGYNYKIFMI